MNAKNLPLKFGFVILMVLASLWLVFFGRGLRQGIDLRGGHMLVFELTSSESDSSDLVVNTIKVLKDRIDPMGLSNIEWRPQGSNRFEVRMPAANDKSSQARTGYNDTLTAIEKANIHRGDIQRVLQTDPAGRDKAISAMAAGNNDLLKPLEQLARAYDVARKAGQQAKKAGRANRVKARAAYDLALNTYEEQLDNLLKTNIKLLHLQAILKNYISPAKANALGDKKEVARREKLFTEGLADLKAVHPARAEEIQQAADMYKRWSVVRRYLDDPSDLKRLIAKSGILEFRVGPFRPGRADESFTITEDDRNRYAEQLLNEGPEAGKKRNDPYQWFKIRGGPEDFSSLIVASDTNGEYYVLLSNQPNDVLLCGDWKLDGAHSTTDTRTMTPAVGFEFDPQGAAKFAALTSSHKDHAMAILLDNEIYSAPTIQSTISSEGIITGRFSSEDVEDLVRTLNAGRLKATLNPNPVQECTFAPAIGAVNRQMGKRAAVLGLICVAVFMLIYYLRAGFIADVALVLNLILVVGAMSMLSAVFTLPGIAGLILTIGIAVDANVLIFERLREEQAKSQSVRMALKNAYQRAFSAIFDANITTLITCLILGWVGTEEIRGFAITLGLGIVFSLFTALVVTRWMFQTLLETRLLTGHVFMLHIIGVPKINWMSKRHFFWGLSLAMMVLGVGSLIWQGSDVLGIEFSSGTRAIVRFKAAALIDGQLPNDHLVRKSLSDQAAKDNLDKFQASTRVEELIDEHKVGDFLNDYDTNNDRKITQDEWQGHKLNDVYFAALDKNQDKILAEDELDYLPARSYQISTTETSVELIRNLTRQAFGDALEARLRCDFKLVQGSESGPMGVMIPAGGLTRITTQLLRRIDPKYLSEMREYLDGVMIVIEDVKPAVTTAELAQRIRLMRNQPDFASQHLNPTAVIGLSPSGDGYAGFAVLVRPIDAESFKDASSWEGFAKPELDLLGEALHREEATATTNFDPQIAGEAKGRAVFAMVLSCMAIIGYLWLRFGSIRWGLAAVICLLHDVIIVVGLVAISGWLHNTVLGRFLAINSFKIDLAMIAALLTVIGYSVNDTIVVFDRIRENRGKLVTVSAGVINASVNQTLSRTLLTSSTTLIVVLIMYVYGGVGIHAFSYALLAGILFGTYSSVAVASPLLMGFKKALVAKTVED